MRFNLPADVLDDLKRLPSDQLRVQALRMLERLRKKPRLGQALGKHPGTGDLRGYRKIYFDESEDRAPRYRIVYRLLPDEANPQTVDVVVVGRKAGPDLGVYVDALRRLGP